MSNITQLICNICAKVINDGDVVRKISWHSLGGGGGDRLDHRSIIVHTGVCLVEAEYRANKDEHPYGENGIDLSVWDA